VTTPMGISANELPSRQEIAPRSRRPPQHSAV
jgi:hypothetical protein